MELKPNRCFYYASYASYGWDGTKEKLNGEKKREKEQNVFKRR